MAARSAARTAAETFALVFGVVYGLIAVLGFAVTGLSDVAGDTNLELLAFELNPLHNLVHAAAAGAWLAAAGDGSRAKRTNVVVGAAFVLLALLGFAGVLESLLSVNAADNGLHLATGALALYFGTVGAEAAYAEPAR